MKNTLLPKIAKIIKIKKLSPDSNLFTLRYKDRSSFEFIPGQFSFVGLPGFGEAAFDICGNPQEKKTFEFSIRAVGDLTRKIHCLKKGDIVTVRGPYGNGLSHIENLPRKNIVFIGGGCGFVTARAFIYKFIKQGLYKDRKFHLYCGVKDYDQMLFKDDFKTWSKYGIKMAIAVETFKRKTPEVLCKGFVCGGGMVTDIMNLHKPFSDATVIMCGPPVMYKFVIAKLKEFKVSDTDIYLSLERRMHCGTGVCQHCAVGPYYVCKDGPIFRYDKIKEAPGSL